jgi:hypothetical protein
VREKGMLSRNSKLGIWGVLAHHWPFTAPVSRILRVLVLMCLTPRQTIPSKPGTCRDRADH